MDDVYLSIGEQASAEFKEKGSKFLAFTYPVENEEEIKENLQRLKVEYWDASHHCYAYMLGPKYDNFRANDAGEPNHSAGDPILSQIRSYKVTDVLVVVVRYFGGTKLGVPGLISAYKTAAKEVLNRTRIIEKFLTAEYTLTFSPDQTSLAMKCIKITGSEIIAQNFDYQSLTNTIQIKVRKSREELFAKQLEGSLGIQITRNL